MLSEHSQRRCKQSLGNLDGSEPLELWRPREHGARLHPGEGTSTGSSCGGVGDGPEDVGEEWPMWRELPAPKPGRVGVGHLREQQIGLNDWVVGERCG